jgi:hypothetical protein
MIFLLFLMNFRMFSWNPKETFTGRALEYFLEIMCRPSVYRKHPRSFSILTNHCRRQGGAHRRWFSGRSSPVCGPRALPDPPRGLEGGGRTRSGLTGCLRRRGSVPSAAAVRRPGDGAVVKREEQGNLRRERRGLAGAGGVRTACSGPQRQRGGDARDKPSDGTAAAACFCRTCTRRRGRGCSAGLKAS